MKIKATYLSKIGPRHEDGHGMRRENGFGAVSDASTNQLARSIVGGHGKQVSLVGGQTRRPQLTLEGWHLETT